MSFPDVWSELRETARARMNDVTLLTPSSRRRFTIEAVDDDRILIEYPDDGEERTLPRDQFEALYDRIEDASVGLAFDHLPPRTEPYAAVLSLSPRHAVDADRAVLHLAEEAVVGNPLVVEGRPEPTPPERVHGDLLLLADLIERLDVTEPRDLSMEQLADLYVLLSEVQRGADEFRRAASDVLIDRVGPEGRLHGRFGTVHRTIRERRRPKPDEEVFAVLDRAGVPREWVTGVDPDKLDVVLAVTDVEAADVYDVAEQVYVQKTGVQADEKRSRLQGIKDRIDVMETPEADEIRGDVEAIEARLDALLASG